MIPSRVYILALLCVGLIVGGSPAAAQDVQQESSRDLPLRGSNRAISFTFDGLSLDEIDGGVGGKWWLSTNTAMRTSIDLSVVSDEDIVEGVSDRGLSAVAAGLSLLIEWHSADFGRVSPYLGSGFSIGGSASSETLDFGGTSPLARRKIKSSALDFAVNAAFGVEVRISRRVSLSGEHLFGARVHNGSRDVTETFRDGTAETFTKGDLRGFTLSTGTSSLIVSVYF